MTWAMAHLRDRSGRSCNRNKTLKKYAEFNAGNEERKDGKMAEE
jgi:hypothetical protein